MNRVFPSQVRKARGVLNFSKAERQVLAAAGAVSVAVSVAVHLFVAIGMFVVITAVMLIHRRMDNHRADHLEILILRLVGRPVWSLCEQDSAYVRFKHGK